jgi:hypothetical protein
MPEEVFDLAGMPEGTASGRASKLLALELFREDRVSLDRAAACMTAPCVSGEMPHG